MPLKRNEYFKIVLLILGAMLTILGHIIVREWYQPNVLFQTGGYYISESKAITSLSIANHGNSNAENMTISLRFTEPIRDIRVNKSQIQLEKISGGIGEEFYTGKIPRLWRRRESNPQPSDPYGTISDLTIHGECLSSLGRVPNEPTTAGYGTLRS